MQNKLLNVLLLGVGLVMFSAGCLATQKGVIYGTVVDNNNRPVTGAMVTTEPPSSSMITDNLGRYVLSFRHGESYSVTAEILGYESRTIIIQAKPGDITQADIKLLPEGLAPVPVVAETVPVAKEIAPTTEETPAASAEPAKKKKWWEK